ncbi:MAG: alpha/beta fold hydrolase [Acidimicrobiales bacterium]|jgi:2-succinyl-6-hydroxy-2,4-cyclohexadiene-1-carboxylate synthase
MSLLSVQREGSGPPFVWLHGFTHTRASAHRFRSILAGDHELLTFDLPGHGTSAALAASLEETADLVVDALDDDPVALGGYSLGARVALHVALRHPDRVSRLVLLGATRGIEDPQQRRARRERDETLAARIEVIGTSAFLDEWLAQAMFAALPVDPVERLARSSDGPGLANSLRRSGTGTQEWLEPRLSSIEVATLALAGAHDEKFTLEARAIADRVARGRYEGIAHANHAAHLEAPEASAQAISSFLAN